jgi:hypothetical protein
MNSLKNNNVLKGIICEESEKKSKYRNIYWKRENRKWCVQFCVNGERQFGGYFNDELDAAKRVNQLCEEMQIPSKNPAISAMPNQQYQVTEKYCLGENQNSKNNFFSFCFQIFCS